MQDSPIPPRQSAAPSVRFGRRCLLVCLLVLAAVRVEASPVAALCDQAAEQAARAHGVPVPVMQAVTRTETGRNRDGKVVPWPWTVNMEGRGHWFETAEEARAFIAENRRRGAKSFDVGCFQINHKWHGDAFASVQQMFDPAANADYAARFLVELFEEFQSWEKAAGAYHSRTPEYAERYILLFSAHLKALDGRAVLAAAPPDLPDRKPAAPAAPRVNRYPLIQSGAGRPRMGSLVPEHQPTPGGLFGVATNG